RRHAGPGNRALRSRVTLATLGMMGLFMPTAFSAGSAGFKLPPYTSVTLDNGLRLYVVEDHALPLVELEVIVGAGASNDPAGKEGVASMVAGLLRKGAGSRSAREIADAVDFVGGSLSAAAHQDATRLDAEFLSKDLNLALELLTDILCRPAFDQDEVDRIKSETLSELKGMKENPGLLASRRFIELLYRGHPYGHPSSGWESSVASITRDQIRAFYAAHYAPDNSLLVAVGDFKTQEILEALKKRLSGWKGSVPKSELPVPKPSAARAVYLADKPDATQSQIRIGGIGIRRSDPDYIPMQVANTILGGGFTSRLVEEIRVNRGLSYGVSSRLYPFVKEGPFLMSAATKNATTLETIKVALEILGRFRSEGPTEKELDKARKYIRGGFAIEHESPDALAESIGEIAFYGLPSDYYDTYLEKISAVTIQDVKRVASTRMPFENAIILVLGKASEIKKDVDTLGSVNVIPLSTD
ncbi:MAG TPA: pitrilysin family protein, partial [Candidatus Polarisedimenticolia bacterium]|nr:pitrilysin family protein [Candidatus Polarisedimenticolia bacterium]